MRTTTAAAAQVEYKTVTIDGLPAEGAYPYKRDLKNLEFHLLDTGHFALEEDHAVIAELVRRFLDKHVSTNGTSRTR